MKVSTKTLLAALLGMTAASGAYAAEVNVASDITTSTTWTANNVYHMVGQIYVRNGATLTIEAGTRIASRNANDGVSGTTDGGSLAVCRGSKIYALGTASKPIVFTSTADNGTARVGDGSTANLGVAEWGNLTLMGRALIGAQYLADGSAARTYQDGSGDTVHTNTANPTGLNLAVMEGLTPATAYDPNVLYGGSNDNDDSGTICYVSLRYGGKVTGLNIELNGLSMGAVGRNTDVHHIDIYNNVDDGIETWGGTVNYKYISIWNIGDDSFDVDEGWRGKGQFYLIVQGYGTKAAQGSGVGDNLFETDGAEANNAVPTTTSTIYNVTAIGQPDKQGPLNSGVGGDQAFAMRDNARLQYRNMLIIQAGEQLIKEESSEGGVTDNWRYGQGSVAPFNTTPLFDNTATGVWGLAYSEAWNTANAKTGGNASNANYLGTSGAMNSTQLQQLYQAQSAGDASIGQGKLCEVTDSLFYDLQFGAAYTLSNSVGVTVSGGSNAAEANVVQTNASPLPIAAMTRGTAVQVTTVSGSPCYMANITHLDPRRNTANTATVSHSAAPADGFFTPALYRGAFSDKVNWCLGWTAASEFGIYSGETNPADPTATIIVFGTSFQTATGNTYVVESSTDGGINWTPEATFVGDGTIKNLSDFTTLSGSKIYRLNIQ